MKIDLLNVGIQGVVASFHDVAARKYFPGVPIQPAECATFKILCEKLQRDETPFAMMAIENTIAGSILTNYSLLERYHFQIVGEVYLRIELHLMALPGQRLDEIEFVQSHPMAHLQCETFLAAHAHLKPIETTDTAESAKNISEQRLRKHAAIASALAAETYGLEVLAAGIETNKQNYTRFLVISKKASSENVENNNKASVRFETKNEPGSLVRVLESFSKNGVNMTKIQSVPMLGKPYQYAMHADIEWTDRRDYLRAIQDLETSASNLLHFGEYQKGEVPFQS